MATKRLRQSQHRPERDVKHARELQDLKRQNNRLSRQNARLRKQVEKTTATRDMFEDLSTADTVPLKPSGIITAEVIEDAAERCRKEMGAPGCPNGCGPLLFFTLGPKDAWVCGVCKYRQTTQS